MDPGVSGHLWDRSFGFMTTVVTEHLGLSNFLTHSTARKCGQIQLWTVDVAAQSLSSVPPATPGEYPDSL